MNARYSLVPFLHLHEARGAFAFSLQSVRSTWGQMVKRYYIDGVQNSHPHPRSRALIYATSLRFVSSLRRCEVSAWVRL